ncbi:MAG: hypothetical protein JWR85_3685, partial [Marmoricola sp.]|nr:hypothetical protein [Marmoricola sp.]
IKPDTPLRFDLIETSQIVHPRTSHIVKDSTRVNSQKKTARAHGHQPIKGVTSQTPKSFAKRNNLGITVTESVMKEITLHVPGHREEKHSVKGDTLITTTQKRAIQVPVDKIVRSGPENPTGSMIVSPTRPSFSKPSISTEPNVARNPSL